nr:hypothetical protein BaRGS_009952 [Batillaria attramentaria]
MVQFSLLFTEEVTSQIRHDVARVLLAVEAEGKVIVGNVTFGVVGHSGIYDEKSKLDSENDDMDWYYHFWATGFLYRRHP